MRKWVGVRDIKLLRELASAERGLVAVRNHLTNEALTQRIRRIKGRFRQYEWYVKQVWALKAHSRTITELLEEEAMRDVTEIEVIPQKPRKRRKTLVYIKGEREE